MHLKGLMYVYKRKLFVGLKCMLLYEFMPLYTISYLKGIHFKYVLNIVT